MHKYKNPKKTMSVDFEERLLEIWVFIMTLIAGGSYIVFSVNVFRLLH